MSWQIGVATLFMFFVEDYAKHKNRKDLDLAKITKWRKQRSKNKHFNFVAVRAVAIDVTNTW